VDKKVEEFLACGPRRRRSTFLLSQQDTCTMIVQVTDMQPPEGFHGTFNNIP
jgi:hypothetical protein